MQLSEIHRSGLRITTYFGEKKIKNFRDVHRFEKGRENEAKYKTIRKCNAAKVTAVCYNVRIKNWKYLCNYGKKGLWFFQWIFRLNLSVIFAQGIWHQNIIWEIFRVDFSSFLVRMVDSVFSCHAKQVFLNSILNVLT